MSDNGASAADARLEPVAGAAAFESNSESAIASRGAQLMGMSLFAFGNAGQVSDIQQDAAELAVPQVMPDHQATLRRFADLDQLEGLANAELARVWRRYPGHVDLGEDRSEASAALWREIDETQSPKTLLALLAVSSGSEHDVEAASAAAGLHRFSEGESSFATEVLLRLRNSDDSTARAISGVALSEGAPPQNALPPSSFSNQLEAGSVSLTAHGTWGMVGSDPWYRPGARLHRHIRDGVSRDLFDEHGYFVWSGGFSAWDRDEGARDLRAWRADRGLGEYHDIYAHSHGGNVALSAAAAGERIRMLVLMHTPALPRSDDDWTVIRGNIGRVVVMRTRMDLVVLADGLRNGSRQKFDPRKLPHFPVTLHWANGDGWFSHGFYVDVEKWEQYHLAEIVQTQQNKAVSLAGWPSRPLP